MLLPHTSAAQARSAASAVLEEVVVTARRREESLEDLPLSVVAISGDAMQAQGIYRTNDIGDFAANVTLNTSDRKNHSRIFIRGIGGGFPNPIQVFGSGMYIDGHYLAGSVGNYMSTTDVERVEVLRGPQGTLFGKNTTGGAINIISAKPGPEFDSYLTARLGDFGQQDLRGMINFPISDTVFARVSAASEQNDGYYYNRFLNSEIDYTDIQSFRGALRFTPNENWTIDLTYQAGREDSGNQGAQCRAYPNQAAIDRYNANTLGPQYTGPSFPDGEPLWGGGGAGLLETAYPGAQVDFWNACETDRSMGDYVASNEKIVSTGADQDALFVSADWDSNGAVGSLDNLQVQINASWRYNEDFYVLDRDKTNVAIDAIADAPYDSGKGQNFETTNFEILLNADASDRLSFTTGIFYYEEDSRTGQDQCWDLFEPNIDLIAQDLVEIPCSAEPGGLLFEFLPQAGTNRGGPANAFQNVGVLTESVGVFGHMTYAINDDWDLAVGARYTEDDRSFHIVEFDVGDTCFFIGSHICQPQPVLSFASVFEGGFFNSDSASFNEVTPTISLSRNLAGGDVIDSGMVYVTLSEGYLTGSFNDELNLFANPALAPLVAYDPEHVTNYEVGFKGTLADGRVRLTADVFLMDYTDKHEAIDFDNSDLRFGPDPNIEIVSNAGQVDIYGIELELRAQPWENGALTLDFGYLVNEYNEFFSADPDNPGELLDYSNRNIGDMTPDWTLNMSLLHTFQLANGGTLTPQIGMFAQGGYEWLGADRTLDDPKSYCYQDSYARFRARLTYEPPEANWEVALYGYNITDERYFTDCDQSRSAYDYTYGAPEWWGLEFTARWGDN